MNRNGKNVPLKIGLKEAKEALLRSGYLIESRIEALLRSRGYYVEANVGYRDADTGKTRELDIYAMTGQSAGPNRSDWVFGVFFIECMNNTQPVVFLTKEPVRPAFQRECIKASGLPVKFPMDSKGRNWRSLADYLAMERFHHYCISPISTQFCSFARKKTGERGEWMALHEDSHFDVFRRLCAAVEDSMLRHYDGWKFDGREWVNIEICHPVVVLQGDLMAGRVSKRSVRLRRVEHIQYYRPAVVDRRRVEYQIDVVTERYLPRYMDVVEAELAAVARRLRRRYKNVRRAINLIVPVAKRATSLEETRAAMELR